MAETSNYQASSDPNQMPTPSLPTNYSSLHQTANKASLSGQPSALIAGRSVAPSSSHSLIKPQPHRQLLHPLMSPSSPHQIQSVRQPSFTSPYSVISHYATTYLENGALVTRVSTRQNRSNASQEAAVGATVSHASNAAPSLSPSRVAASNVVGLNRNVATLEESHRQPYQVLHQRSLPASPSHRYVI